MLLGQQKHCSDNSYNVEFVYNYEATPAPRSGIFCTKSSAKGGVGQNCNSSAFPNMKVIMVKEISISKRVCISKITQPQINLNNVSFAFLQIPRINQDTVQNFPNLISMNKREVVVPTYRFEGSLVLNSILITLKWN